MLINRYSVPIQFPVKCLLAILRAVKNLHSIQLCARLNVVYFLFSSTFFQLFNIRIVSAKCRHIQHVIQFFSAFVTVIYFVLKRQAIL